MKSIVLTLMTLVSISLALPWPIATTNLTHKIDGNYGGSNILWEDASSTNPFGNFHAGIDIFLTELTPAGDEEEVYTVEPSYIQVLFCRDNSRFNSLCNRQHSLANNTHNCYPYSSP